MQWRSLYRPTVMKNFDKHPEHW